MSHIAFHNRYVHHGPMSTHQLPMGQPHHAQQLWPLRQVKWMREAFADDGQDAGANDRPREPRPGPRSQEGCGYGQLSPIL